MWIIQEPKKLALWNKRHFEEKKRRLCSMFKICSTLYLLNKYIKWMQHLEVSCAVRHIYKSLGFKGLTQHVSGIIMSIVRRTDCIKPHMVLACMCWLRLCGVGTRTESTVLMQSNTCIHTMRSARVPTPHNRSQHIQANTRHDFIQSVLLTMDIMMPETCWVNLLLINIYTCVIYWFFLLLR